ncbi:MULTISPECIES: hypothetical protein [Streptomyces]|uniref:hypothetical protein n=1 Tax=Streptomyces TaxID=1883 RepID=UPI0031F92523
MIATVGHPDLTAPALQLIEEQLRSRLARFARAGGTGLVRAARGLPPVFGRAARSAGLALVTVLPARGGLPALLREPDRAAAGELLILSERAELLEYDPEDRGSCIGADEHVLRNCSRLLAVWDGSPSTGRDATAHLVAFARSHGVPVDVLWPRGARRSRP